MRTIGVTGGTRPALAIWARLSMYCRQSRSRPLSQGLCSISNTQPSYFEALIAIAESVWAGAKQVSACWPASRARMTLLRRGKSAIFGSLLEFGRHPIRCLGGFDNAAAGRSIRPTQTTRPREIHDH